MNDKERGDIIKALVRWFESQDIMPADAGICMTRLIAQQFVLRTRDLPSLINAIEIQNSLLTLEVAGYLRQ